MILSFLTSHLSSQALLLSFPSRGGKRSGWFSEQLRCCSGLPIGDLACVCAYVLAFLLKFVSLSSSSSLSLSFPSISWYTHSQVSFVFGARGGAFGSKLNFLSQSWSFKIQVKILEPTVELSASIYCFGAGALELKLGLKAPQSDPCPLHKPPTMDCHFSISVNKIIFSSNPIR